MNRLEDADSCIRGSHVLSLRCMAEHDMWSVQEPCCGPDLVDKFGQTVFPSPMTILPLLGSNA